MKVEENNRFVTTVGNFEVAEFTVKQHNLRNLMGILRDKLYSDKKLAPIREYSCNAYDANVENGKRDVPIKVTLPTSIFPEYKIRDYGKGLSYEAMKEIFCSYGESTKRDSNDFIGQLGIGSKSGFAYGDNFLVTSYMDGKKSTYNCLLDKTGVGSLLHLATEDSDEQPGLEITIPVKSQDLYDFKMKSLNFFKYWDVYPEIVGISKTELDLYKDVDVPVLSGPGWNLYSDSARSNIDPCIIMGNISYPLDWDLVYDYNSKYENEKYVPFYNFLEAHQLVLRMDIGTIEMAPSREALQYTEKTIAAIRIKVDEIINAMRDSIQQKISQAKNIWEAKYIYAQIFGYVASTSNSSDSSSTNRQLEECFTNVLSWNNIPISSNRFEKLHLYDATLGKVERNGALDQAFNTFHIYKDMLKHGKWAATANAINCDVNYPIVINDTSEKIGTIKKAIRWYLINNKNTQVLYYLNFKTEDAKKAWFTNLHFSTVPTLSLKEIMAEYVKNKPKVERVKLPVEMTKIGYINLHTFYRSGGVTNYETVDLKTTTGTYVYAEDRIVDINGKQLNQGYFLEDLKHLNSIFSMGLDTIYIIGPRIKKSKKFLEQNWIPIADVINAAAKRHNSISNYIEHTAYNQSLSDVRTRPGEYLVLNKSVMKGIIPKIKNKQGVFNTLFESYPDIDFKQDSRAIRSMQNIGLFNQDQYNNQSDAAKTKYMNMWTSLYKRYRMLKYINIDFSKPLSSDFSDGFASEVADYINMVDGV